jgi:prepilin peptidase CpaA
MDFGWGTAPSSVAGDMALGAYIFALVMAAVSDIYSLRIPNWLTGGLAAAFPLAALAAGHDVDWLSHLAAGGAVFAVAAALFFFRIVGGGDVKLLAAAALWIGLGQLGWFLVLVALVGGGFAVVLAALRHPFVQTAILATLRRLPLAVQAKMPIPYGVPIAVAGIIMAPSLTFLT